MRSLKNRMDISVRFADLLAIYRAELLGRTIPFWMTHALDQDQGGILTCISDEGHVLSTDKYLWSQLRAIWTFSALYNKVEPRQEWLDAAWHIYNFVKQHGRDENGRWVFSVNAAGDVLQGPTSIYTEGFAIYGLTELARATGEKEPISFNEFYDVASKTYITMDFKAGFFYNARCWYNGRWLSKIWNCIVNIYIFRNGRFPM